MNAENKLINPENCVFYSNGWCRCRLDSVKKRKYWEVIYEVFKEKKPFERHADVEAEINKYLRWGENVPSGAKRALIGRADFCEVNKPGGPKNCGSFETAELD